jgi:hypothetical protein
VPLGRRIGHRVERLVLGAIMTTLAFLVERRLLKALRKKR